MDIVCRSFVSRLDRRRILLIIFVRFYRFVEEVSLNFMEVIILQIIYGIFLSKMENICKMIFLFVFVGRNVVIYKICWMFVCKRYWFICRNVFFQFSVKFDDFLEMLCSEIEVEDVSFVEVVIQNFIDKCENLGIIIFLIM